MTRITDELDNCPDTPSGSTVDENGCAIFQIDSDNDGISDDLDLCPDTPENTSVSSDGCPLIYLAEMELLKSNRFSNRLCRKISYV